jgi:hypothetical protein
VDADQALDFLDQIGGGIEGASTDSALSGEGEAAFVHFTPTYAFRLNEFDVPMRPACAWDACG